MSVRQLCLSITAIILLSSNSNASIVVSGIPHTENQPFPFALGSFYHNPQTLWFFVGAGETPSAAYRDMSISYATPMGSNFVGIMPETITINDVPGQPNPLFGAAIEHLSFSEKGIITTTQAQKNVLCLLKYYTSLSSILLYTAGPLKDADGNISQGIIALEGNPQNNVFGLILLPATGNFGDTGSQVSFGGFVSTPDPEKPSISHTTLTIDYGGRIERSTPALKVGSNLASIGSSATIHLAENFIPLNDENAKNLAPHFYVGISAIGGPGITDGVRGILMNASVPITPEGSLEANSIVGGIGPNTAVHINHLNTLHTSTELHYLVIAGGVGTESETDRTVYALPLTIAGTLAHKNAIPITVYHTLGSFWYRCFITPAQVPGDLFSPDHITDIYRARVGGNASLPGPIASLWTAKDNVFVSINENNAPERGGIFCSQGIFDTTGCLQGWTDWRRVNGLCEPVVYGATNQLTGNTWAAVHDAQNSVNTIVRTEWDEKSPFPQAVTHLFADQRPGTQGLIDFPLQHPAFDQTIGNRISLIVATGYNRIALIQSGSDTADGFFTATQEISHIHKDVMGGIGIIPEGTEAIIIEGARVAGLGGIVTADIVSDDTYSWLVVGGNGGLAILARPDGTGWPKGTLGAHFSGLPADATFKGIGKTRNVRKVIADGNNIYFLSDNEARRFTVSPSSVAAALDGETIGTLLASEQSLRIVLGDNILLSDMIVSGPVALIGTSNGLVRVGNERSIALDDASTLDWQYIALPESSMPVTRFYVVSPTGMQNTWATTPSGGNIYVVSGNVSLSQTRIHRFAIKGSVENISDTTVQLFQDHFRHDVNPSFFFSRGDYRNYVAYDGTIFYLTRSHYHPYGKSVGLASLESTGAWLRTGRAFAENGTTNLVELQGSAMGQPVHRSAQGSMITSGSSMYSNE